MASLLFSGAILVYVFYFLGFSYFWVTFPLINISHWWGMVGGGKGLVAGKGWWRGRAGEGEGLVAGEGWRRGRAGAGEGLEKGPGRFWY